MTNDEIAFQDFRRIMQIVMNNESKTEAYMLVFRGDCPADTVVFNDFNTMEKVAETARDCNSRLSRQSALEALFQGGCGQFEPVPMREAYAWLENPGIPWFMGSLREYGEYASIAGPLPARVEAAYKRHVDGPLAHA